MLQREVYDPGELDTHLPWPSLSINCQMMMRQRMTDCLHLPTNGEKVLH